MSRGRPTAASWSRNKGDADMSTSLPSTPAAASGGSAQRGMLARLFSRFVPSGRTTVIGIPFLWLTLFFAVPFVLVLKISFADQVMAVPPYSNLVEMKDGMVHLALQLGHYAFLLQDSLYIATYISSLKMAAVSTVL